MDVTEAEEDWWGPEGPRAVTDRMQAFVDRLRTSEDDDIIVVGHSLFLGRYSTTSRLPTRRRRTRRSRTCQRS